MPDRIRTSRPRTGQQVPCVGTLMHRRRSNRAWPPLELSKDTPLDEAVRWLRRAPGGAATVISRRGCPCGIVSMAEVARGMRH